MGEDMLLKEKELDVIRKDLEDRLKGLTDRIEGEPIITVLSIPEVCQKGDDGEKGFNTRTRDEKIRRRNGNEAEIKRLKAAIGRLDNGTFGLCLGCEDEISPERIRVRPTAEYCISCQTTLETLNKGNNRSGAPTTGWPTKYAFDVPI